MVLTNMVENGSAQSSTVYIRRKFVRPVITRLCGYICGVYSVYIYIEANAGITSYRKRISAVNWRMDRG